MSEVKEQGNSEDNRKGGGLISKFGEGALTKVGESIGELAVNSLVRYAQNKYHEALLLTGEAFNRYLTNSINRLNQIKTIATGGQTRSIMGSGSIYVEVGVSHRNDTIPTNTVNPLLDVKTHILIEGTGGAGKSMLMRYLFLKTAEQGDYLPVFLNLRQISRQKSGEISILDLIHDSLKDYDREFGNATLWEQFVYSLNHGKYLFLMDGFDEIKESMAIEAAEKIQKFCAEFPWNACIITTRPEARTEPLETFETMRSLPLNKSQAIELVKKIWDEDEQTLKFCYKLQESLFDDEKYNSFACNPLLLSMMGLTFRNNNFIPGNAREFYEQVFETLYRRHDANDKGAYRREFECGLDSEDSFKEIFAQFCFQTYFKAKYEFSKNEIISSLKTALQKVKLNNVSAEKYLVDLQRSVCMIVNEGNHCHFSHRAFQTYFAAYHTSLLEDEQQRLLFKKLLDQNLPFWSYVGEDYYSLLFQIQFSKFTAYALEDRLRDLLKRASQSVNPDLFILKSMPDNVFYGEPHGSYRGLVTYQYQLSNKESCYDYNVLYLFRHYIAKIYSSGSEGCGYGDAIKNIKNVYRKLHHQYNLNGMLLQGYFMRLKYLEIDDSNELSDKDRESFYAALIKHRRIPETREAIRKWLAELDAKRAAQKTDTLDDLIDSL